MVKWGQFIVEAVAASYQLACFPAALFFPSLLFQATAPSQGPVGSSCCSGRSEQVTGRTSARVQTRLTSGFFARALRILDPFSPHSPQYCRWNSAPLSRGLLWGTTVPPGDRTRALDYRGRRYISICVQRRREQFSLDNACFFLNGGFSCLRMGSVAWLRG